MQKDPAHDRKNDAYHWFDLDTIVRDGKTGFTFDEPTAEALAAAMRRSMTDELDPDALVASARRFDRARFDAGMLAVLESVLGRPVSIGR